MSRYITDLISQTLGTNYVVYSNDVFIPESIADLPKDGKVYAIVRYQEARRGEQIVAHNVTYGFSIEFFVPADRVDQFQADVATLRALEAPYIVLGITVKINIGVAAVATSSMISGQYWVTYNLNGDVVEFSDLTIGDDIKIYHKLSEEECTIPAGDPSDYVGIPVTSVDGSVWAGAADYYEWQLSESEIENPMFDVAALSLLPDAVQDGTARVVSAFVWNTTTPQIADYGYIVATSDDLPPVLQAGIKAATTGFDLIVSSYAEWMSGYAFTWTIDGSLTAPFDYELQTVSALPTLTVAGRTARVRELTWYVVPYGAPTYGFIKPTLEEIPYTIVDETIAAATAHELVSATVGEYTASGQKVDISVPEGHGIDDVWYALSQEQEFEDLGNLYYYGGVIKASDGVGNTYYKLNPVAEGSTVFYQADVATTLYKTVQSTIKPRITVTVAESPGPSDVYHAIQSQHPSVFSNLSSFYSAAGVVRANDGLGSSYWKLFGSSTTLQYWLSNIEGYQYYVSEPVIVWQLVSIGEGDLIDVEDFNDSRLFQARVEPVVNNAQEIERKVGGYTGATTTLSFTMVLNPSKVFDRKLITARHSLKQPSPVTIVFKYNQSAFGTLAETTYEESYFITSISRAVNKRSINSVTVSLERGLIL